MNIARPLNRGALIVVGLLLLVLTVFFLISFAQDRGELVSPTLPAPVAENSPAATLSPSASPLSPDATTTPLPLAPSPTSHPPTLTFTPSPEPTETVPAPSVTPAPLAPVSEWERAQVPDLGLAFEIPAAWSKLSGDEWAWSPDGSRGVHIGLDCDERWVDFDPSEVWQPPALIVSLGEIDFGWTGGRSYRVEVRYNDRLLAIERHLVIDLNEELACDFFNTGRTWADQVVLWPVLYRMTSSLTYQANPGGPIETAIDFLAGLIRDPSGEETAHLLSARLRGQNLPALFGGEELYHAFAVDWRSAEEGRVLIQATLHYEGGRVQDRLLTLIWDGDLWLVDAIDTLP